MLLVHQPSYAMWSHRGLCHRLLISWGVVQELVAALGSLAILLLVELVATIPSFGVMAFAGLDGPES